MTDRTDREPTPGRFARLSRGLAGAVLGIPARVFSVGLRVLGRYRPLNSAERFEAKRVFGASLDLDRVRITERGWATSAVLAINGRRPFTIMNAVHCSPRTGMPMRTTVHELVHVWQGQHEGQRYMLEALHAQFFGEGYTVTDAHLKRWDGDFQRPNREQQAALVERYWLLRWGGLHGDWHPYWRYAEAVHSPLPGGPEFPTSDSV